VIAAGIQRVVASMDDPNPQVSGRGFEKLRAAGIQVETGLLENEARRLNESFARYIRHGVPLVTLKAAMTLDGKIAPPPTESFERTAGTPPGGWITSESAREHVQELRHQHDAIMVGAGTILRDDPLLTDRSGHPRRRPLLRVILDSRLRLPVESRLLQSVKNGDSTQNDVLVFSSAPNGAKKAQLEERGIRVEQLPAATPGGRPDLHAVLGRLGQLEITNALIEGGATVNGAALASGIVDKVFLYYTPKILAGNGSVPFSTGAGFRHLNEAAQVKAFELHRFGEEFAVEGYVRDPYGE
jgi:diaminohydroxyphosphoribosylaminopyrimidine deaminase/5-amino-6-(5-phosphoribosylamino)uracil reductase